MALPLPLGGTAPTLIGEGQPPDVPSMVFNHGGMVFALPLPRGGPSGGKALLGGLGALAFEVVKVVAVVIHAGIVIALPLPRGCPLGGEALLAAVGPEVL